MTDTPTEPQATPAELLARASSRSASDAERRDALLAYEQHRTASLAEREEREHAMDFTRESVRIVPQGGQELHRSDSDWLLEPGLTRTASANDATEAEHALIVDASLWFDRVPDFVKDDAAEFKIQAEGQARKTASSYGDHYDAGVAAFMGECDRLMRQAGRKTAAQVATNPTPGSQVSQPGVSQQQPGNPTGQPGHNPATPHAHPGDHVKEHDPLHVEHPGLSGEIERVKSGQDAAGVREQAQGFARSQVQSGLNKAAALQHNEDSSLESVLAGLSDEAPGPGEVMDAAEKALDSTTTDVSQDAHNFAQQQRQAASQVPQVGSGVAGYPSTTFPSFAGQPAEPNTSSNRAPALQEIADFTGWDGSSVVPPNDNNAELANGDYEGHRDASYPQDQAGGFPVSGSVIPRGNSAMTEASCPTCGGHGKVAVHDPRLAYSRLPQIDQIVDADDTPDPTAVAPGQSEHYPEQVAFPLIGLDPNNVSNAINQAEQQISQRNAQSPLVTQTRASRRSVANGRDNSGWAGDMGARGVDYPGYSSNTGLDGSNNLGQPDPAYGYGGDQGQRPGTGEGKAEEDDVTNGGYEPWTYGQPLQADQGQSTVSPTMSTAGSRDPFIAQAQAEIARQQETIRTRMAMLGQRG